MSDFKISWFGPHSGEEPPISGPSRPKGGLSRPKGGTGGSGTIFFCKCNLKCVFCQNWQISQKNIGCQKVSSEELLKIIFSLQEKGCHNINLVSPTMWASGLKNVLKQAKKDGLKIPVVWNCNGYETLGLLGRLGELVDIYLPDYKYSNDKLAEKYSGAVKYSKVAKEAILEMQNQVGDLMVDKNGIAKSGMIIRHLILPGYLDNTRNCLEFIRSVSSNIHLSLMSQYNPTYKAKDFPEINRTLSKEEYEKILVMVRDLDFKNGWVQEFGKSVECLNPDFTKENPFNI